MLLFLFQVKMSQFHNCQYGWLLFEVHFFHFLLYLALLHILYSEIYIPQVEFKLKRNCVRKEVSSTSRC